MGGGAINERFLIMAFQFQSFKDFKTVFKIHLDRVKSGKERHAPSVAAFERVNALFPKVENNDLYRNIFLRHVNRYLVEVALHDLFLKDALAVDIYLDALHGNLASICWQLGIDDNDDETKAALQFVLDETGEKGAQE